MNDQEQLYCYKCGVANGTNHERDCWYVRDVPYPFREKVKPSCCEPQTMSNNDPQRLSCRNCDAPLGLHHFEQCPYWFSGLRAKLVTNHHCNYDDEYKLPDAFQEQLGLTHYCHIHTALRVARKAVHDIELLCRQHDVKIPS